MKLPSLSLRAKRSNPQLSGGDCFVAKTAPRNDIAGMFFAWFAVILLPLFAIFPALSTPIEEHSYDAATFHVYRGVLFSAARTEGIFYPRWIQPINAGLGGPLFSFYSPSTYFALDALNAIGLPIPIGWRVLVALSLLAASMGVFLLARSLDIDSLPSLAASALFVYAFPFLRELFERGSPEGFAIALYPWVLWSLVRLVRHPTGWRIAMAALTWAAAILTHNLSALLLVPLFGVMTLVLFFRHGWRSFAWATLALTLGVLLSAFFTLPFIVERDSIHIVNAFEIDYAQIARNAFSFIDLMQLPPMYDIGLDNNFIGDHLGPISGLVLLAGIAFALLKFYPRSSAWLWRDCAEVRHSHAPQSVRVQFIPTISFILFAVVIIWLQTSSANGVWDSFTFLSIIQIRTRLLGLVVLCVAIVGGLVLNALADRWRRYASYALIAITILLALPVLYPQLQYRYAAFEQNPTVRDAATFAMRHNVPGLTAFNEFMPIWRTQSFTADEASMEFVASASEGSKITRESRGNEHAEVQVDLPVASAITFRTLYFPGWVGYIDGKPQTLKPIQGSGYTLMENVPAGTHTLSLRYEGTAVESIATIISIVTAIALLVIAALSLRGAVAPPRSGGDATKQSPLPRWGLLRSARNDRGVVLLAGFAILAVVKSAWIDPQTTLFRGNSRCESPQVRFGENISLCGIDIGDKIIRSGDSVRVTLYWQVKDAINEPTESFMHLYGAAFNPKTNTPLWGQQDKQAPGYHPITEWTPGKMYRDSYEFQIDPETPPGDYQLEIGWWQPSTGQRVKPAILSLMSNLSVSANDSLLVSGIVVR